ncbi:hypothetical protein FORC066_0616 [Yersinia enterocolitica]|nr:hypothetical protein FORC065_3821 [Yersinia enterocolitica]UXD27835.1 hypothetical protein FORC066_0616 [Yersinia enterocolitica]
MYFVHESIYGKASRAMINLPVTIQPVM